MAELEAVIRDIRWVAAQHDGNLAAAIIARCDSLLSTPVAQREFGMFDNGDGTATLWK